MWPLLLVASLALNLNCNADSPDYVGERSKADSVVMVASKIANARSINEMMKHMDLFSRKFPPELLNDKSMKPFASKFKQNYDFLWVKTKPILLQARKLEKMGKKKSKKQLDAFEKNIKILQSHVDRFTKTVNSDSKKLRKKNLRIMKSHPNDVEVLEDAKRFINVADMFSQCIGWITSIPGSINCFVFGNCETGSGGSGAVDGGEDSGSDGEETEEEEDEEDDPDDSPSNDPGDQ